MLGQGWLSLKQAQDALKGGRLDDALQLLTNPQIQGHKKYGEFTQQLQKAFVDRAEKQLRRDDADGAWQDVIKAESLGIINDNLARIRNTLSKLGIAEVKALLEVGKPERALETVAVLKERGVRYPELIAVEDCAKSWIKALENLDHGEFHQAQVQLRRCEQVLGTSVQAITELQNTVAEQQRVFSQEINRLHKAAKAGQWSEVLELSEKLLANAPSHEELRKLRSLAWRALEPSTIAGPAPVAAEKPIQKPSSNRYILWIDGVGGYLLCLDATVTIGQASPETQVEIPIYADISRMHATISRDHEGYVIKALRPIIVNQGEMDQASLNSNDRITLGNSCQLVFQQDVPISTTAKLSLVSGHRFLQAVDAVFLMGETLLIGPGNNCHIQIPELKDQVVIYRCKDSLGFRCREEFELDGKPHRERAILDRNSQIRCETFSLSLEKLA